MQEVGEPLKYRKHRGPTYVRCQRVRLVFICWKDDVFEAGALGDVFWAQTAAFPPFVLAMMAKVPGGLQEAGRSGTKNALECDDCLGSEAAWRHKGRELPQVF